MKDYGLREEQKARIVELYERNNSLEEIRDAMGWRKNAVRNVLRILRDDHDIPYRDDLPIGSNLREMRKSDFEKILKH